MHAARPVLPRSHKGACNRQVQDQPEPASPGASVCSHRKPPGTPKAQMHVLGLDPNNYAWTQTPT